MKDIYTLIAAAMLSFISIARADLAFDVRATGTPSAFDLEAAALIVGMENERITAENETRASADPPGDPLPVATVAQLRTSYLGLLAKRITEVHANYAKQAAEKELEKARVVERLKKATPEQRQAVLDALAAIPE